MCKFFLSLVPFWKGLEWQFSCSPCISYSYRTRLPVTASQCNRCPGVVWDIGLKWVLTSSKHELAVRLEPGMWLYNSFLSITSPEKLNVVSCVTWADGHTLSELQQWDCSSLICSAFTWVTYRRQQLLVYWPIKCKGDSHTAAMHHVKGPVVSNVMTSFGKSLWPWVQFDMFPYICEYRKTLDAICWWYKVGVSSWCQRRELG